MNNKDPQWRQEMADILKMLETAEGRLHEALKESHFSSNQSNDNIKNDNDKSRTTTNNVSNNRKNNTMFFVLVMGDWVENPTTAARGMPVRRSWSDVLPSCPAPPTTPVSPMHTSPDSKYVAACDVP